VLTVAQDSVVKFKVHLEDDDAQASLRRSGLPAAGAWRACMVGGVALLLTPFREDGTFRITLGLKNTCEQRSSRLDENVQTPNVRNIKLTQLREAPLGVVAPEHAYITTLRGPVRWSRARANFARWWRFGFGAP
jgi:hypothetical protein